jgi:hypothetical protein
MTEQQTNESNAFGFLIVLAAASPVLGVAMALMMDDPRWLWLCLPIFLFLS